MNYFCFSFNLSWGSDTSAFFFNDFLQLSDGPFNLGGIRLPILAGTVLTWATCWFICYREVSHGIEKASMIFMPLLFVLTLILVGWSLRLEGAWEAIKTHYLSCDFSKISLTTQEGRAVWVAAFGQILRGDPYRGEFSYDDVIELARSARGEDPFGYRAEFISLVRLAKTARAMGDR